MKRVWWLTLLGVLLCSAPARADVVAPGFKFRELRVVIDNLNDYPDYSFYLVAAPWVVPGEKEYGPGKPDKPSRVTLGQVHRPGYSARWQHDWMLVAVPRERADSVDWKALAAGTPGVLHSNRVRLAQPSPALVIWPRDYELRHFRVSLADGQLALTPGAVEEGANGSASWLPGLIAAAALTGMGLWIAHRIRRRSRPTTTAER